ncbi:hypothetical protein [Corallococcus terminator]|uniref:hypothetical protein n=1 Tax=Corallococcus terminator TaxID=2316733 RepID=UPI001ABF8626|nr:hypothetical protein [Corallococcus terminator]
MKKAVPGAAQRAGVSRGAGQHHFPTRAVLVAAEAEHVFRQQLPERQRRVEPLLNLLSDVHAGPRFKVAMHLWVAAVANAELKRVFAPGRGGLSRLPRRPDTAAPGPHG